jgi:hypothetical protein
MQDYELAAEELKAQADRLELWHHVNFVPLSKSRNAKGKSPTINWRVKLFRGDKPGMHSPTDALLYPQKNARPVWEGDYSQGIGHLVNYRKACTGRYWDSIHGNDRLKAVVETGKDQELVGPPDTKVFVSPPSLVDILSSLCMDASAIDEGSFEDWASSLGYDTDSRKAHAIWQECIEVGLKLRSAIGDTEFQAMRDLSNML